MWESLNFAHICDPQEVKNLHFIRKLIIQHLLHYGNGSSRFNSSEIASRDVLADAATAYRLLASTIVVFRADLVFQSPQSLSTALQLYEVR